MLSKRFLIVPLDSSAARMPLPFATIARAIDSSSLRFILLPPACWQRARGARERTAQSSLTIGGA